MNAPVRDPRGRPARVACLFLRSHCPDFSLGDMSEIRFVRMAEALARRGHEVDLILNRRAEPERIGPRLREVPTRFVRWEAYDVVKTFFHAGFESLVAEGGGDHPFIVSKLGSVVAAAETEGVHFYGEVRERLFAIQQAIAQKSRAVTVLTEENEACWRREHGPHVALLRVPTGVDAVIPPPGANPYERLGIERPVALFAGNLYSAEHQPEVNALWQDRLNRIGRLLMRRGLRLVAAGNGDADGLDPAAVLHVGRLAADEVWDWQRHARVGLVLAQGAVQDNESSKLYYYLRTGLPVVCERPVPNAWLVGATGLGAIVDYGDVEALAEAAVELARRPPSPNGTARYMVEAHSWDARAAAYDEIFAQAAGARA
ncbi:MAG: hypothetical protein ACREQQ_17635 [Candidatus Binatia bacterium]